MEEGPARGTGKKEMSILISCLELTLSLSASRLSVHLAGSGVERGWGCGGWGAATLISDVFLVLSLYMLSGKDI